MLRVSREYIFRALLFLLFICVTHIMSAASLPASSYVTSNANNVYAYIKASPSPCDGYYSIEREMQPMLMGPPELPPDPGAVPVGDWIPLMLFALVYGMLKIKIFKFYKKEI